MTPAAHQAASAAAARLRQGLRAAHVVDVEAVLAEDNATVLVYALAAGRTFATCVMVDQLSGADPQDFARHLHTALAR